MSVESGVGSSERTVGVFSQLYRVDHTQNMQVGSTRGSGKNPNTSELPGLEAGRGDSGTQTHKNVDCVQGWLY